MKKYIEKVCAHNLPSWQELPDFELYMDQVISLMQKYLEPFLGIEDALTPSMINNYVKMDVLPAPIKKKYSKEHLARLIVICLIKRQLSIPIIGSIMAEQIEKDGIEKFFNSFKCTYEESMRSAVKKAEDHSELLTLALDLAVNASTHRAVGESAVNMVIHFEEMSKKEKKEKKK